MAMFGGLVTSTRGLSGSLWGGRRGIHRGASGQDQVRTTLAKWGRASLVLVTCALANQPEDPEELMLVQ